MVVSSSADRDDDDDDMMYCNLLAGQSVSEGSLVHDVESEFQPYLSNIASYLRNTTEVKEGI